MDILFKLLESSDEEEIMAFEYVLSRKPKMFKPRVNVMTKCKEREFLAKYRVSKDFSVYLANLIEDKLPPMSNRNKAVSVVDQVLLTLGFFASGNLKMSGFCGSLHRSTMSRIVRRMTKTIAGLRNQYIHMPRNKKEIVETTENFYKISKFPNCIGVVNGTHIPIQTPSVKDVEMYRIKKNTCTVNVQAVFNADLLFTNIDARSPGTIDDSSIFYHSDIRKRMTQREFGDTYLLGDNEYSNSECLLTPFKNPITRSEVLYNKSHQKTVRMAEKAFKLLKRRFPALGSRFKIKLEAVEDTIVACAVLHNLCRIRKEPDPPVSAIKVEEPVGEKYLDETSFEQESNARALLINNYFR